MSSSQESLRWARRPATPGLEGCVSSLSLTKLLRAKADPAPEWTDARRVFGYCGWHHCGDMEGLFKLPFPDVLYRRPRFFWSRALIARFFFSQVFTRTK